jgi:hypothetical protein
MLWQGFGLPVDRNWDVCREKAGGFLQCVRNLSPIQGYRTAAGRAIRTEFPLDSGK